MKKRLLPVLLLAVSNIKLPYAKKSLKIVKLLNFFG